MPKRTGLLLMGFLALVIFTSCGGGGDGGLQAPECALSSPRIEQHDGFRAVVKSCADQSCEPSTENTVSCRFLSHTHTIEYLDVWGLVYTTDSIVDERCKGSPGFTFEFRSDARCETIDKKSVRTAERTGVDGSLIPIEAPCENLVPPLLPPGFCKEGT